MYAMASRCGTGGTWCTVTPVRRRRQIGKRSRIHEPELPEVQAARELGIRPQGSGQRIPDGSRRPPELARMDDREPGEHARRRAAKVILVVPVRDDVARRPFRRAKPLEGVLHHARVHGDDRGGVPDHPRLEPPLQLGERARPNRHVVVGAARPRVAEIGDVRDLEARPAIVWAMRIAVGGNEVADDGVPPASARARRTAARTANGCQSTCASGTSHALGCSRPRRGPPRGPGPPRPSGRRGACRPR